MANILFITSVIQLVFGTLYGWIYWNSLVVSYWQAWVFIFSGPIYFLLGISTRWTKRYSLLIGLILYSYLAFTVHPVPHQVNGVWQDGLMLKLPILEFLFWGLLAGNNWNQPDKQLRLLLISIFIIFFGFGVQYEIREVISLRDSTLNMQDSLKGAVSNLPPTTRMNQIVSVFCETNAKIFKMLTIASCILGICSLSLALALITLIIQTKKENPYRREE